MSAAWSCSRAATEQGATTSRARAVPAARRRHLNGLDQRQRWIRAPRQAAHGIGRARPARPGRGAVRWPSHAWPPSGARPLPGRRPARLGGGRHHAGVDRRQHKSPRAPLCRSWLPEEAGRSAAVSTAPAGPGCATARRAAPHWCMSGTTLVYEWPRVSAAWSSQARPPSGAQAGSPGRRAAPRWRRPATAQEPRAPLCRSSPPERPGGARPFPRRRPVPGVPLRGGRHHAGVDQPDPRRGQPERVTRKPTSSLRKDGWLRRRTEARQLQCSSNQPPPRRTRYGPYTSAS